MARIAAGGTAVDLSTPWGTHPNPWTSLLDGLDTPVPATMGRLGYPTIQSFAAMTGFVHRNNNRIRIACHPLWTEANSRFVAARQEAERAFPGAAVTRMNPFRLLRRPADYI
jgi:hypothetical protein